MSRLGQFLASIWNNLSEGTIKITHSVSFDVPTRLIIVILILSLGLYFGLDQCNGNSIDPGPYQVPE